MIEEMKPGRSHTEGMAVMIFIACLLLWLGMLGAGCAQRKTKPFDESAYKRQLMEEARRREVERFASYLMDKNGEEPCSRR